MIILQAELGGGEEGVKVDVRKDLQYIVSASFVQAANLHTLARSHIPRTP